MTTYTERYSQLAAQRVYQVSASTSGLPALLAPYTIRKAQVLTQQTTTTQPLSSQPISG